MPKYLHKPVHNRFAVKGSRITLANDELRIYQAK